MLSKIGNTTHQLSNLLDQQKRASDGGFADVMAAASDDQSSQGATSNPSGGLNYASIEATYTKWSAQRRADGAGDEYMDRVDAAKQTYLDVAKKAEASGGFQNPLEFLKTLTSTELKAIQTTQSIGVEIDPSSLTAEGAFNLLVPRPMARDVNGDGKFMVGTAQTVVFPPGDAPQAVKDAWEKATAGMDSGMKMDLQMSIHLASNADAGLMRDWSEISNYRNLIARAVDGAEFNLNLASSNQRAYASQILAGLNLLQTNLDVSSA